MRRSLERKSTDQLPVRDQPRRSTSDLAKVPAKPEDSKDGGKQERPQARPDARAAAEAKHAQRDGRHAESDRRHAQRDSHRAEPNSRLARPDTRRDDVEAKHAQRDSHRERDSDRLQRAAHKEKEGVSHRPRSTDDSKVRATPATKRTTSRSGNPLDLPPLLLSNLRESGARPHSLAQMHCSCQLAWVGGAHCQAHVLTCVLMHFKVHRHSFVLCPADTPPSDTCDWRSRC